MDNQSALTLINPQSNTLAFKVYAFEDDSYFAATTNYNYYSMILVTEGNGSLVADVTQYKFSQNSLICFAIYQPFSIKSGGVFKGTLISFHPDFFCLHKHRNEVSCNGVMFNNIYDSPVLKLDDTEMQTLTNIAHEITAEMRNVKLAQYELLISYLKIFLINASRIKINQLQLEEANAKKEPAIVNDLKEAIEQHFKSLHSSSDYADLLNASAKVLNRVSKTYFNKTLSSLITERIIIEAKRELYLTPKSVKLIGHELGFTDEFYFSRFFKSKVAVSPQLFRDTVGFDRADA
jgi:AraC family transcriptional activator of pobA